MPRSRDLRARKRPRDAGATLRARDLLGDYPWGSSLLVAAAALVCYFGPWTSVGGPFLYDDRMVVTEHPGTAPFSSVVPVFTRDFWGEDLQAATSHKSWRPATTLSYRFGAELHGRDNTFGFHFCDRLIHAAASAAAHAASLQAGAPQDAALVAALLFAAHPVHVEVVSNVAGRAESLCGLIYMAGFAAYAAMGRAGTGRGPRATVALLATFWAMTAKEHGVTLPAACGAWEVLVHCRGRERDAVGLCGTLFGGMVAIALWRRWLNGGAPPNVNELQNPACFLEDARDRFLSYSWTYVQNVAMLLWPSKLCADWTTPGEHLVVGLGAENQGRLAAIACFYLGLPAFGLWSLLGASKPRALAGFALAWAAVTFGMSANVLQCVGFVLAERVLYLPSFGACLLAALALSAAAGAAPPPSRRTALAALAGPLVLLAGAKCWAQDAAWRGPIELWGHAYSVNPRGVLVAEEYGSALSRADMHEEAIPVLRYAHEEISVPHSRKYMPCYHMSVSLMKTGRAAAAREALGGCLALSDALVAEKLAAAAEAGERGDEAGRALNEALAAGDLGTRGRLKMCLSQTTEDMASKLRLAEDAAVDAPKDKVLNQYLGTMRSIDASFAPDLERSELVVRYADSGADPRNGALALEVWYQNETFVTNFGKPPAGGHPPRAGKSGAKKGRRRAQEL